jgi:uncharacterized protein
MALALAWLALSAFAADSSGVLPVPPLSGRVIDQTGTLSEGQRQAMELKLAGFEQQAGAQVVVLLVPTTAPEDIAAYAQRVGDAWKIGRKDVGDGLLIVVAKNDRAVNIQTTKALEGAIPDLAAHQIITNVIVPAFRKGDYAGGLNAALDQLMARIRGENLPAPPPPQDRAARHGGGIDIGSLLMFFFVGVPVIGGVLRGLFGRRLGSLFTAGGAGFLAATLSGSALLGVIAGAVALLLVGVFGVGSGRRGGFGMPVIWGGGGGGWSGGGGGGSGFSSGGGGDFGGGGASGRW